jgi:hypothetical protein
MVYLGFCKAEYKYSGNTTNLSQHLSKVHPDEIKQNSPATLQQMFNRNEDTSKSLPLPSKRSEEITRTTSFISQVSVM